MEQLLIQATIMRAKRLARRLQGEKATSTGEEMKFPGLNPAAFENDNAYAKDINHANTYTAGVNNAKSYSTVSLPESIGRLSDPTIAAAERSLGLLDFSLNFKGKI